MKRILVPCDFSEPSKEAFKMAAEIASKTNGSITVLHVIYVSTLYTPEFVGEPTAFSQQFFNTIEEDAKKAFGEIKKYADKEVNVELEITVGGLHESMKRLIKEKKIELVVMGTSGSSGMEEILIGSNTERAVRFSEVPVLAVRKAVPVRTIKNILLPTIGNLDQKDWLSEVKALQTLFSAKLHLLLINTPSNFMRDEEGKEILEEFVKHYDLNNYELHFRSYVKEEEGIIDFVNTNKMDLVAMATHSRRGLAHLFTGSVTEDVVNHIQAPVWTYTVRK
jgi:nucleotide-binding universal stress UspA family protein